MTGGAPFTDSPAEQLAIALSIAVRIEPELIRAIRVTVLPQLDVSAESDLWFADDLVASRGPDSIVLKTELLPALRARLAERFARSGPGDPVRSVGDITARVHATASPALALEERVAWLSVTQGDAGRPAIEDELGGALYGLRVQGRTGIADWLVGAWPRLPESVRGTKTAWQLRQAAGVHADTSRLPVGVVPADLAVADLADFAADIPDVPVAVRLAGGQLELGDIGPLPGAVAIPLLDTDPRIVELLPDDDGTGPTIAVPKGGRVTVLAGSGPVRLLTPRGLVYQVTPYAPRRVFVPLPGSERQSLRDAVPAGELDLTTRIDLTLVLRRREPLAPEYLKAGEQLSGAELAGRYGADPQDIARVREVLTGFGFDVLGADPASRRMFVAGPLGELARVFGTELRLVSRASASPDDSGPVVHRYRTGGLSVPAELDGVVIAVLGLDDRPQVRPCVEWFVPYGPAASALDVSLVAPELAQIYRFPQGAEGDGQTLAILEFEEQFSNSDLTRYFGSLAMDSPTVEDWVVGGGGVATPSLLPGRTSPGGEPFSRTMTGVAVSGALAPKAKHVMYFARKSDQGVLDAISLAVHANPVPTAIVIGWGQSEDSWTAQARTAVSQVLADAAALGITVCVASGDGGSQANQEDGQSHVFFPASSPYALACGGTSLRTRRIGPGRADSEVVWPSAGGGVSDVFVLPAWQVAAGVPPQADGGGTGRGVPDVAASADPSDGYAVPDGTIAWRFGGTATAAALWAALVCRLAQATGRRPGFLHPVIYDGISPGVARPGFHSITLGSNGAYRAGPGWDACTGLGSPDGTRLLELLSGRTGPAA
jgi:kumamolisin